MKGNGPAGTLIFLYEKFPIGGEFSAAKIAAFGSAYRCRARHKLLPPYKSP